MDELQKYALSTDKSYSPSADEQDKITKIQYEFCVKMQNAEESEFIETARKVRAELGFPILYFKSVFKSGVPKSIESAAVLECVIECFDCSQINKKKLMQNYIDVNRLDLLEICVKHGWLAQPKKRDELIFYANEKCRTEAAAYLLEFKNSTADLKTERKKAEKKLERELNADPNSVSELKKSWRFDKLGDGTLIILGYKGGRSEIYVPKTIGQNTVTAIGNGAFSPLQTRISQQRFDFRMNGITKITLPETIKLIDPFAFSACRALREVVLPKGLTDIGYHAFYDCEALEKLTLSGGVKYIAEETFAACPKLTVYVRRGSHAERYCRERGVRFEIREDE